MCGILAIFNSTLPEPDLRRKLIECAQRLRHRGPDWSGYLIEGTVAIAHERLAIIDPESGAQPLRSSDNNIVVCVNGEIYNYKELYSQLAEPYAPRTGSDCEVLIPLYLQHGPDFANLLRGMFSFVLYDRRQNFFMAVRDHMGITPLYVGYGGDGAIWFASEMKALAQECNRFEQFMPGSIYKSTTGSIERWYNPEWLTRTDLPTARVDYTELREAFERAVVRRMMSDVPWGVLLSGGLDSSLVASVAVRHTRAKEGQSASWWPKLHSFCVGLEGSPDLCAAKKVAEYLDTVHHTYTYTIQEGLDAIREVIYHLETYDTTTVRASIPMFLMSRKIKATGIKMVLSGEGSDEIFGGYLYFHKCPNRSEFQDELKDKLSQLYMFDCLRANKSTSAWGVEARVPFLDRDFLDVAMGIDPADKMVTSNDQRIEKYILRRAFDTPENPYLPNEILWRQKEQFSDGVGYGWIDSLKQLANERVSDNMFEHRANRFTINVPATKEAYMYRTIFEELYPQPAAVLTIPGGPSIACSTARAMRWSEEFSSRADPSGRAMKAVHSAAYGDGWEAGKQKEGPIHTNMEMNGATKKLRSG